MSKHRRSNGRSRPVTSCPRFERCALGEDRVFSAQPVMGGEDFSRFALDGDIPITIFWLGAVAPDRIGAAERGEIDLPSLHSAEFVADPKPAIQTGATAMTAAVLDLLEP